MQLQDFFFYFAKVSPEKSNSLHQLEGILASQQLLSLEDGLKETVKSTQLPFSTPVVTLKSCRRKHADRGE